MIKDKDGNTLTETKDILHQWKEYRKGLYTDQTRDLSTTDEPANDQDLEPLKSEVEQALQDLRNGKSPGCDNVPAELLKTYG